MSLKAKWNGGKEDPDQITQYDVVFKKGEWTDLPDSLKPEYVAKFKAWQRHGSNGTFEVRGGDTPDTRTPPPVPNAKPAGSSR